MSIPVPSGSGCVGGGLDHSAVAENNRKQKTQLIKLSIALRAKYRLGQGDRPYMAVLEPGQVVPHPGNRSGDPVKSMRTQELTGMVCCDGFDETEANSAAVAVKEKETNGQAS